MTGQLNPFVTQPKKYRPKYIFSALMMVQTPVYQNTVYNDTISISYPLLNSLILLELIVWIYIMSLETKGSNCLCK